MLPIDPYLPGIVETVRAHRRIVLTAAPGAGKTTRAAPALSEDGPAILLQPRRMAARSIAARVAAERGWTLGDEVGWQVRFDRRFTARTRLLVVTEGILVARLQKDPLLSDFHTIILDEFHERSIHADLAIALARQAWLARDDLRLVVMSATMDAAVVSRFLNDAPIVEVPGRGYPIDISHAPARSVAEAALDALAHTTGQILCFLPGVADIRRTIADLTPETSRLGVEVVELHGSLDASAQDEAVRDTATRRVIVATNIAETSLTVPGVTAVIDSGVHKVARYDAARAIDSLETERITADAADQRAGRAGRTAPGRAVRLWDPRDRLRPHREPEIHRVDLAGPVLSVLAWGAEPRTFEWFDAPRADRLDAALTLLDRLGAIGRGRLTPLGRQMDRLPLHPRLSAIALAAGGAREAAAACAVLSERPAHPSTEADVPTTTNDLLAVIDRWDRAPFHLRRLAEEIERLCARALGPRTQAHVDERGLRRALLAGYPDRVAQRRSPGSPRVRLASGTGAVVSAESGVRGGEFLVALDVTAQTQSADARIRLASEVERDWLRPTAAMTTHRFDEETRRVTATREERYDALVLSEQPVPPDQDEASRLLADAYLAKDPPDADRHLVRRLRFAGLDVDVDRLARAAAAGVRSLDEVALERALDGETRRALARLAPDTLRVPSGRQAPLEYRDDGAVAVHVKLQEVFGLAETPLLGPRQVPVLFVLLAPNGRAVQTTRDLRSFWTRGYPEVRKELRGRYPKHPWPEDPCNAPPTARAQPRRRARN